MTDQLETTEVAQLNYDHQADVLYISFGERVAADDAVEDASGVIRRYKDGRLVGITIMGLKEMFDV